MTVDELRKVVERLIEEGRLANPQQMRTFGPHVVMDIDDHISDEAIRGGRIRVVLRSSDELMLIARALQADQGGPITPKGGRVPR